MSPTVLLLLLLQAACLGLPDDRDYSGFRIPHEGWKCPEIFELPPSRDSFFSEYISARKPVILRGAVGLLKWARQPGEWTDEFLCEAAGGEPVSVVVRESLNHRSSNAKTRMTLCDFVQKKNPLMYITQFQGKRKATHPVAAWMTKFTPYFTVPYFYDYELSSVNMWLGFPAGGETLAAAATTNAHFDGPDNLFAVLSGQKTFHLWDPSSARGMYTFAPVESIAPNGDMTMGPAPNPDLPPGFRNPYTLQRPKTSQVPMHLSNASADPQVNRLFPRFGAETKRAVCVVRPGDMIYFPGSYFHEVVSKGRHLGINFWFRPRSTEAGQLPPRGGSSFGQRAGLAVSDPPPL